MIGWLYMKSSITTVDKIYLMEGEPLNEIGFGFSGLILKLADGRVITHGSSDPVKQFSELSPDNENYKSINILLT